MFVELLPLKQILPLFIPIVAILGGVLIALLAIALDFRKKTQLLEQHHKERLQAIERGIELPPLPLELLGVHTGSGTDARGNADRALHRGWLFLLVGLAISAALAINRGLETAAWGLIPVAIGVANLIVARKAGRH